MDKTEKSLFTTLNKEKEFSITFEKLTLNQKLTAFESNYILSVALIFLNEYKKDQKHKAYFEATYYIILKYSLIHNDYQPIYDISLNFGLYPIARHITNNNLLSKVSLLNSIRDVCIDKFSDNGYTETFDQYTSRQHILKSCSNNISYVAPTSFGKSRIIFDHLTKNTNYSSIAIIVPTKSLISQTTKEVRRLKLNKKILSHDGMYNNENNFIAILTQERALRLLQKHDLFFELIYVDEAHNIFEKDDRNIFLQRLIRMNYSRNPLQKVIYLSPLISNSNNLKFYDTQIIDEQRIDFNIKEPDLFYFKSTLKIYSKYNRFTNSFYNINDESTIYSYIHKHGNHKNFIYLRSPRNIEDFAKNLYSNSNSVNSNNELNDLIIILDKYVHKDFYIIDFIKKGIIYLHGKIPDHIKDYLEFKFKTIPELKFLIANNVILEGINLPIDTLFILNTHGLDEKKLTNLIGRVNRLDNIFNSNDGNLKKLFPPIHFIDSEYCSGKETGESKIKLLRSRHFSDLIENPTLYNFDFDKLKIDNKNKEKKKKEYADIVKNENFIFENTDSEFDEIKAKLILNGIHHIINLSDKNINILKDIISRAKTSSKFASYDIIDKIYLVFLKELDKSIADFEVKRLINIKARNYYKRYLKSRKAPLKIQVAEMVNYFEKEKLIDPLYYIGDSYGEIAKETLDINIRRKCILI